MDDRKTIGANFKRHLKSKAMSQREAASLIGISAPHLANLLNGVENMGYIVAKKICTAFPEISPEYLLTGEGVLCPPPGAVRITAGYVTLQQRKVDDVTRRVYDYVAGTWEPER